MNAPALADRSGPWSKPALGVVLILVAWAVAYFPGLATLPLCDPEESRSAVIVADMLRTGRLLVPHLDGAPYFEKPPLFFWLAAGATRLTGQVELGGRIISALSALGAGLCAWWLGRRMFSPLAGLLAGVATVMCVETFGLGRWYRMEMLFAFFLTAALACFWHAHEAAWQQPRRTSSRAWLGFYLFAALAVLTKGPIGLLLPALVVVVYLGLCGQWRRTAGLLHPQGLLLFALLAAPWFVFMLLRFPDQYLEEFFIRTHLRRAVEGFQGNIMPPGFYLLVLAVGFLPWTVVLPAVIARGFPWPRVQQSDAQVVRRVWQVEPARLFLWTWVLVIVVFFELSRTKFIHYVLSVFPALGLLAGEYLAAAVAGGTEPSSRKWFRGGQWLALAGAVALAAGLPALEMATGGTDPWALLLAPAGLATVLGIRRSLRKARPGTFAAVLAGGMTFIAVFASLHTMPRIYEKISMRPEGLAAAGLVRQAQRVILLGGEKRSLLVYAGRPDGVCAALGRVQALTRQLRAGPAALLLAQPERLEALKASSDQIEYSQPIQLSPRATLVYTRPILRPTSRTVSGSAPAGGGSPPPG